MADHLGVALLGPVEVRVDGEAVALPGTTARAVLARLALSPNRVVPVSDLVDVLWPDDPPEDATGNLQSYVSRLRRAIGAERVVRQAGGYRLRVAPGDVDVGQVAELVDRSRTGDRARAAELLAEALELWRGEPLADVAGNLAFAPELARLREWRVHLLGDWLEARLGLGPAAEALPELERAARSHPMRERLQLLLIRGLHADGRTAEALAVDRLVLIELPPDVPGTTSAADLATWIRSLGSASYPAPEQAVDGWLAGNPLADPVAMRHYVEHCLAPRADGRLAWRFDASGLTRLLTDGVSAEQLWAAVDRIAAPALLIRGCHSPFLSAATAAAMLRRLDDGSVTEIRRGGHDLGVEQPAAVAAATRAFLLSA